MRKSLQAIFGLSFLATLLFTGCHKEEKTEVDNETQSAVDNAVADQEYMAVVPAVNGHAINTKGVGAQNRIAARCDSLTIISGDTLWGTPNHSLNPTYTMNISNGACAFTMADGRLRSGVLYITLTGRIKTPGSKMIITMQNYRAGGVSYKCDSMIVTTLASSAVYASFRVQLFKGVCESINPNNSWNIKYMLDRTISLYPRGLNGNGTDPATYIYGTATGTNRSGRDFSVNIPQASPLLKIGSCEYISNGIMELTPKDFATRTIDFGYSISPAPYGGCDEDASFTVNGSTVAFKLK